MKGGWIYIMTNAPFGTLYIGVTADLARRAWQHRHGEASGFCRRYGLTRLVYCEEYPTIDEAIARESDEGLEAAVEDPADRPGESRMGGSL